MFETARRVVTHDGALGLILLSLLLPCLAAPAQDPQTGKVRVLYIGDCFGVRAKPYIYMLRDPLFRITPIPIISGLGSEEQYQEQTRQLMRQYMPRTLKAHLTSYDLVVLGAMPVYNFRSDQMLWFKKGVEEAGQGLMMIGGYLTFGGKPPSPSWSGTSVDEVLPVYSLDGQITENIIIKPVPVDPNHGFCTSLPWAAAKPFFGMNIVLLKEGAFSVLKGSAVHENPLLAYWEIGRGSSMAHAPDWAPGWGESFMYWQYFPDYVCNLLYLLARLQVPQDLNLMHAVRAALHAHIQERGYIQTMANFVEGFGGNPDPIYRGLARIEEMTREAYDLYAGQDYEAVIAKMDEVSEAVANLGRSAIELKNRAMAWIYAIEWLTISGTLMTGSYILWTLMVRRRLYRQVTVTRLAAAGNGSVDEHGGSG